MLIKTTRDTKFRNFVLMAIYGTQVPIYIPHTVFVFFWFFNFFYEKKKKKLKTNKQKHVNIQSIRLDWLKNKKAKQTSNAKT